MRDIGGTSGLGQDALLQFHRQIGYVGLGFVLVHVVLSADWPEVEIAIRALGDFTSTVHQLTPGTTVYVDGPHGVFSMDRDEGPGFGFIAGGVGITGLISMLRTMANRRDVRPALLVYANNDWDGVAGIAAFDSSSAGRR